MRGNEWLPEEDTLLRKLRRVRTNLQDITKLFPRHTYNSIRSRLEKLGLTGKVQSVSKPPIMNLDRKMRKCLGVLCGGKMFMSDHGGIRLCSNCRSYAAHQSGSLAVGI